MWAHLIRRFFGFLKARPLTPREQSEVEAMLAGPLAELFWRQSAQDQRHALDVAHRLLTRRPGDREAACAALLHDVGKRNVGMGAIERSMATVLGALGAGLRGRYHTYLHHGRLGAGDLEAAGAGPLAVAFARHHPGAAPEGFDRAQWQALLDADRE